LLRFNRLQENVRLAGGLTLFLNSRKPTGKEVGDTSAIATLDEDDSFSWDQPNSRRKDRLSVLKDPIIIEKNKNPNKMEGASLEITETPQYIVPTEQVHEVKSTDTLYSVARQYGVTIKDLMEWNDKKDFALSVGEKLRVRSH